MRGMSSVKANSRNFTPRPPVYSQTHFWFVSVLPLFSKHLLDVCPCVVILSYVLLVRHELLISFVKHLHNSRLLLKAANRVSVLFAIVFTWLAAHCIPVFFLLQYVRNSEYVISMVCNVETHTEPRRESLRKWSM